MRFVPRKDRSKPISRRHISLQTIEEYVDGELGGEETPNEAKLKKRLKRIDVVVGGPMPEQLNLNNHTRGDDPRNELYVRMIDLLNCFSRRWC